MERDSRGGGDDDGGYLEHPITVAHLGLARMVVFPDGGGSALIHGQPGDDVAVRLQSACQYGEIYGSLECDCRAQLDASLATLAAEGSGVIVHLLAHEGRGSGLRAKATAYQHRHERGLNTFESYVAQKIPMDRRDYGSAIDLLTQRLGLTRVRLLTNNPEKVQALESAGLCVERVPLVPVGPTDEGAEPELRDYLQAKAAHGHLIGQP